MIRHTNIPDVHPGEPITAGLANQIIAGANTARVVTGDDSEEQREDGAARFHAQIMGLAAHSSSLPSAAPLVAE